MVCPVSSFIADTNWTSCKTKLFINATKTLIQETRANKRPVSLDEYTFHRPILTCVILSFRLGERCLRVVVVAMVVVVSIMVVDMSAAAGGVAEVVSVDRTEGASPTKRKFPVTCTFGSPSAANFSTCSPL